MYLKHAAILFAVGLLLQLAALLHYAPARTPGQAGAQRAAPLRWTQDAPNRPHITGIDHVRLYVTDVDKSRAFYAKSVGLSTTALGACRTVIYPCLPVNRREQIELQLAPSPAPKNWVAEIAYATSDVGLMREYLLAHEIKTTPIATDPNGARHFETSDPEENPLSFVQRSVGFTEWLTSLGQVGSRLLHAGFVVKDVQAENKFYVDLLGFRLYWHGGFKDDGVDWYEIQVPDGDNWIEYMLNIPANADHKELGVQNHFSLGVKDANGAAAQLRKNGLQTFDGPEIGRDGKNSIDAYDPDGTRVEIMEFTPTQKPCCHPYTAAHPTP